MSERSFVPPQTRSKQARSRVTNGALFAAEIDQRTVWARRFRDVLFAILADLGGDENNLSEAQRQIARRCAAIATECEALEARAAIGESIDLNLYGALTDRLGRAFQRIGISRQARDVTPSLSEYLGEAAE